MEWGLSSVCGDMIMCGIRDEYGVKLVVRMGCGVVCARTI